MHSDALPVWDKFWATDAELSQGSIMGGKAGSLGKNSPFNLMHINCVNGKSFVTCLVRVNAKSSQAWLKPRNLARLTFLLMKEKGKCLVHLSAYIFMIMS